MRRRSTGDLDRAPLSDADDELKMLRQNVAELESRLASERLAKRAANQELRLLKGDYPWRAVAAWRRLAQLVPLPAKSLAPMVDRLKRTAKRAFKSGHDSPNAQRAARKASAAPEADQVHVKVALVTDCDYWALANIARHVKRSLPKEIGVDIINFPDFENELQFLLALDGYDLVHFLPRWVLRDLMRSPKRRHKLPRHLVNDRLQTLFRTTAVTTAVYEHMSLEEGGIANYQQLFTSIDGYTVCSPRLQELYSRIGAYPPPTALLRDGVDLDFFIPANRERFETAKIRPFVVGWAGNSAWQAKASGTDFKGLHSILRPALETLTREGIKIVGNFADRQILLRPYAEMPEYYRSIDVLVCASSVEGTPCPVLEAMACGVPIVSTDVGIVREALGPLQQEFILPERSVEAMAAALRRLHNDPGLLSRLSSENLESIRPWDWTIRAGEFSTFFKSAIEKRRAAVARPI